MTIAKEDIERLSIAERIQRVEDIWDTIVATPDELPMTEAQRQELDRRLEAYHDGPHRGVGWQGLKTAIKLVEANRRQADGRENSRTQSE